MDRKILFIAPHPDDETLGAGGTILKHKAQGDKIFWIIITNILVEHGWELERVKQRQKEIELVADAYQFDRYYYLNLPTTKLDVLPLVEIINKISRVIKEIAPSTIYLQNRSDIHSDHRISFDAVMVCSKSFRYPFIKKILMYETISETDYHLPVLRLIPENEFFHITHLMEKVKKSGGKVVIYPISENAWVDTGEWEEYKKTKEEFTI